MGSNADRRSESSARDAAVRSRVGPTIRSLLWVVGASLGACGSPPAPSFESGVAWPAAERSFHSEPRWLGADAVLSIPLDDRRTLWLFGDTFVATSPRLVRHESTMVRNSVALQTGTSLERAELDFAWRSDGPSPSSFFPERGEEFFWPGHGLVLDAGPLVVFLFRMKNTPGVGLGFECVGGSIAVIDDPSRPLDAWRPRITDAPAWPFDAMTATAVVRDGDHVVALAIAQHGTHAGTLVRFRDDELARGSFDGAQWWCGTERGWRASADVGADGPTFVIDDAGAEASLHRDPRSGWFVHVASYGFGASTIGVRTAPALTGPWSAPTHVYRPPESDGPRPFVYAAKAHPEQATDDESLVVTYATNSLEFGDLFTPEGVVGRYWPRVIRVPRRE